MCLCSASHSARLEALQTRLGKLLPDRGQIGPRRVEPAHPLSPACVWWGGWGLPVSVWRGGHLCGPQGPARPCLHPQQLEGSMWVCPLKSPVFPLGSHKGTLAPTNLRWRATLRENVDLPQPKCLPCLRSLKFFESLMQTLKHSAAGQGMCLLFALSNPLLHVLIPSNALTHVGSHYSIQAPSSKFSADRNLWESGTTYQNSWEMAGIPEIINYSTFSTALYVISISTRDHNSKSFFCNRIYEKF